jgi:hypothetical protein
MRSLAPKISREDVAVFTSDLTNFGGRLPSFPAETAKLDAGHRALNTLANRCRRFRRQRARGTRKLSKPNRGVYRGSPLVLAACP